jgi:hypothetical protein
MKEPTNKSSGLEILHLSTHDKANRSLHLFPPKNRPAIVIPQLPHISHSAMASTEISAAGLGFVLFLPMN